MSTAGPEPLHPARAGRAATNPRRSVDPNAETGAAILRLQRYAGNAAVAFLMGGSRARHRLGPVPHGTQQRPVGLQRFEGPEHKQLGDVTAATIDLGNAVVLTWGEVMALAGDEYPDFEALRADAQTPEGRARIRAALEHDQIAGPSSARLPQPTAAQRAERTTTFILLALENVEHFAAGGAAIGMWRNHHAQALNGSLRAGFDDDRAGLQLAMGKEAFGQHYLTDSFSGAHVRTPRREIIDWYTGTFAPRVIGPFLDRVRQRTIEEVFRQVRTQASSLIPDSMVRGKVTDGVNAQLNEAINKVGGRDKLARWFGLAIAGGVSRAVHDIEGERGVMVVSDAHPAPWRAYGDAKLGLSPVSKEQAELAVLTAHSHAEEAFMIGHHARRKADPTSLPSRIHFAFNSSTLTGEGEGQAVRAAEYLAAHAEARVDIVGHTDPIGTDAFNEGLSRQRAQAVAMAFTSGGVPADRFIARGHGERHPVTSDPRQYRLNRRVELQWRNRTASETSLPEPEYEAARGQLAAKAGPPFTAVERFVPRPAEGANPTLEDWHWGSMPSNLRTELTTFVGGMVRPQIAGLVANDALNDLQIEGYTVRPRPIIQGIVNDLMTDPVRFLGQLFGQEAGR